MDLERDSLTGAKRIGYLAGDFPRGDVPTGFVEKLKQIEESFSRDVWSQGHQACEYCFPGGDSELRKSIESEKISWEEAQQATSSTEHCFGDYVWPDMLAHYITVHQYLPPNEFIGFIVGFAAGREDGSVVRLRQMAADDLLELVRITEETGFFRPDEVAVAREVLTEAASKGEDSGYQVYVAADGEQRLGYVCLGPTPLTKSTWDIYWIAVAPKNQGRGLGRRLMGRAEAETRRKGGRQIIIETSSQELYEPTRGFYRSLGYQEVSRIPDFYDRGDAKVTFAKVLSP